MKKLETLTHQEIAKINSKIRPENIFGGNVRQDYVNTIFKNAQYVIFYPKIDNTIVRFQNIFTFGKIYKVEFTDDYGFMIKDDNNYNTDLLYTDVNYLFLLSHEENYLIQETVKQKVTENISEEMENDIVELSYENILKEKQDYYGKTEASYHFAAEKYATLKMIEENKRILSRYIFRLNAEHISFLDNRIDELKRMIQ